MIRLAPFFNTVRAQLLALVLVPLAVVLPLVIALVVYWGNTAYDRLLIYKINAELVIAHQYLERVLEAREAAIQAQAASARLVAALHSRQRAGAILGEIMANGRFDFAYLLDAEGALQVGSGRASLGQGRRHWPVVAAALQGRSGAALDVLTADQLAEIDPRLQEQAHFQVLPTAGAAGDLKREESRGMIVHAAAPVLDAQGRLMGVLEAGVLLNRNLEFVDSINSIIYTDAALPLGSRGTVTLFLDDVRIATNVRMFEGQRALGTRVSLAVRDRVLGEGKTWLDRAFVVNDWYVSGYEPLHDSFGRRIGMLYVGFLEAPFRAVKQQILWSIVAVFLIITVLVAVFSLHRARTVFRPLQRMDAAMAAIEAGEGETRVGAVDGADEITRLAAHFDSLLDILEARSGELRQLNAELDQKVAERTRALAQANEELKAAQQTLLRSEKLAAIGQLTAGVAHEINNPIAVMQGNLDLLREILGAAAEPVANELRLIDEQIHRVRLIVTKLLQFARPDEFAGYTERVDVNALVADSLVLVRPELRKLRVQVVQQLHATCPVEINRNELQQVLINLMVNALHAMEPVEPGQGRVLTLATADEDDRGVTITVADTGHGISPEHLHRVFDPFFTTKKSQGTGLGLSVSLSLVERYGGTITAESEPDRGSRFTVRLLCEPRFRARFANPANPDDEP